MRCGRARRRGRCRCRRRCRHRGRRERLHRRRCKRCARNRLSGGCRTRLCGYRHRRPRNRIVRIDRRIGRGLDVVQCRSRDDGGSGRLRIIMRHDDRCGRNGRGAGHDIAGRRQRSGCRRCRRVRHRFRRDGCRCLPRSACAADRRSGCRCRHGRGDRLWIERRPRRCCIARGSGKGSGRFSIMLRGSGVRRRD